MRFSLLLAGLALVLLVLGRAVPGPRRSRPGGGEEAEEHFEPPRVPPFLDHDCDLVHTIPGHVADWNEIHKRTVQIMSANLMASNFSIPRDLESLVDEAADAVRRQPGPSQAEQAKLECPLGFLYLKLLQFYQEPGVLDVYNGKIIQNLLSLYPSYIMALSRWPIFPVLAYFRETHRDAQHEVLQEAVACRGVKGVIDWDDSRDYAERWTQLTFTNSSKGDGEVERVQDLIAEQFYAVLRKAERQRQASEECSFGFFYLSATQLVAAAGKGTNHMPPFSRVIDEVVSRVPFVQVSSSPWPIWHVLAVFSDMNKGQWYWGGDRKYFRGFSDWNLRRDELSPLISPSFEFLSTDWQREVMWKVEALKKMDHLTYIQTLKSWIRDREESWGELRPIAMSMLDAAAALAARAHERGVSTRLAYVVLLYGDNWALLLRRMARRMRQLRVAHPLVVIAIGDAAPVCRDLSGPDVICWVPDTASQVHRFTGIQGLIHLGIDVIYMDMDTFLLRDPTQRFTQAAEGWDALFARHGDGDCVNIGVFYLKASDRSAVWMSQFLTWYHDHPFEIDQRGLHIFLGLPAQVLQISNLPRDLVKIKGSVLEDWNEVVIGDIGWLGSLSQMLIFHWCHRPLELKVAEMNLAYDAADALEDHDFPLPLAMSVAAGALQGTPFTRVVAARYMFDAYKLEAMPQRKVCW